MSTLQSLVINSTYAYGLYRIQAYRYILSHTDYCNTIWGNTTKSNSQKLLRCQKRAARFTFDDSDSPSGPSEIFFQKLNWRSIIQRIEYNKSVLVFQCLNGSMPEYTVHYSTVSSMQSTKVKIVLYRNNLAHSGAVKVECITKIYPSSCICKLV